MDIFGTILWPIKWVIELVLVSFHSLWTSLGMNPDAGVTWVLSIVGLTIVVRAALIPVVTRQVRNQRRMLEVAPELKKIQDKYRGKKDQFSREAMSRETMELYRRTGTNPLSSCLPLLLQIPIFLGLNAVLTSAQHDMAGVGLLTQDLANSFATAQFFGAPMKATFVSALNAGGPWQVLVLAAVMIVLMTAAQFYTQLQLAGKNVSPETKASAMYRQQRMIMWVLPVVFVISGIAFPIGVMFYWLVSNFWTVGQQYVIIRNSPTPGSEAAKAREERLARKGKLVAPEGHEIVVEESPKQTQRQQPVGKNRSKKKKK